MPRLARDLRTMLLLSLLAGAGCAAPREQVVRLPAAEAHVGSALRDVPTAQQATPPQPSAGESVRNAPHDIPPDIGTASVDVSPGRPIQTVSAILEVEPPNLPETDPFPHGHTPPRALAGAMGAVEVIDRGALPIDMVAALSMTDAQNPQVALARARITEASWQLRRANILWLPSIRAGMNYNKHEGQIQDVAGTVFPTSRGALYAGLGANAVGAGSPAVPGLVMQFHVADAVFQPRIAQQVVCARNWAAQAEANDALLETALAYIELLRAEQDLAIADETVENARALSKLTHSYATTGQGLQADDDRAQTELALRENDVLRAEEAVAVASARLAEQLRVDPSQPFLPQEENIVPIELVPAELSVAELVAQGLAARPEISESRYLIGEAVERLRREEYAPLVPSVLLGVSYGGFGGGLGGDIENFADRLDADAVAFWEVRQFGFGEAAIRNENRSRIDQARLREVARLDRVAREVVEAHAQVTARRRQIAIAQRGITAAQSSYSRNLQRIQNAQGFPLEVLQSVQALATARREYLRTVADFNAAQFRLLRALGGSHGEFVANTQFSEPLE